MSKNNADLLGGAVTIPPLTDIEAAEAALMDEFEAAAFLKVSPRSLQAWRVRGGGPQFVKMGRLVRYRKVDLLSYTEANVARTTAEADAKREDQTHG